MTETATDVRYACAPLEVVPNALRTFLRWDTRHDRMAARVIRAYGLRLPRDRELIRQLAFVFVAQSPHEGMMIHIEERSGPMAHMKERREVAETAEKPGGAIANPDRPPARDHACPHADATRARRKMLETLCG